MQNFRIYLSIKLKAISVCLWQTSVNLLLLLGGDDSVDLSFQDQVNLTLNSLTDSHTNTEQGKYL